jgi:hypothetical protein
MTHPVYELHNIVSRIAAHIEGAQVQPLEYDWIIDVVTPFGPITFRWENGSYEKGNMIRVSYDVVADGAGEYADYHQTPAVNVNGERNPKALAKDITRRLLVPMGSFRTKCLERKAYNDLYQARCAEARERLKAIGCVEMLYSKDNMYMPGTPNFQVYPDSIHFSGYLDIPLELALEFLPKLARPLQSDRQ